MKPCCHRNNTSSRNEPRERENFFFFFSILNRPMHLRRRTSRNDRMDLISPSKRVVRESMERKPQNLSLSLSLSGCEGELLTSPDGINQRYYMFPIGLTRDLLLPVALQMVNIRNILFHNLPPFLPSRERAISVGNNVNRFLGNCCLMVSELHCTK